MDEEKVDLIALVSYIVKRARDEGVRQIGKTFVQKIAYLVSREMGINFGYTMYLYGPFSSDVEGAIALAKGLRQVNVKWRDGEGFLYIMDRFNVPKEKVVDAILRMKPEHDKDWVKRVLEKAEVIT